MSGLNIGSLCIKTAGRKAGEKVIVIEIDKEKHIATIIGKNIKKKKCNLRHLMPLNKTRTVNKNISQKEAEKLIEAKW